ncbi:alpha-S2-casein-like B [Alexandromys fortis]|uniref:alpha-S2-casein-like B n=1 Tax=Alexandromys fortis TaxID=100897 RepID=UPI0021532279|nr:alpha-S2-casein-like B [Microtus fortis]
MKFLIFTCLLAVALAEQNKCYQSSQKFKAPQALKDLYQYHIARNPWGYVVNTAFPFPHALESDILSQQQYNQKMDMNMQAREQHNQKMDMRMQAREKTVMTDEEQTIQDCMNKVKPCSTITWPQFVQLLHQYQKTMNLRSYYPYTPSLV